MLFGGENKLTSFKWHGAWAFHSQNEKLDLDLPPRDQTELVRPARLIVVDLPGRRRRYGTEREKKKEKSKYIESIVDKGYLHVSRSTYAIYTYLGT